MDMGSRLVGSRLVGSRKNRGDDEEFEEVMRCMGKMVIKQVSVKRKKLRVCSENEITIFGRRAWIAVYLDSTQQEDSVGYLGIFVMFARGSMRRTRWTAKVEAQFSVLSSVASMTRSRSFSVEVDETAADWGFSRFMALDTLYDPANGYIHHNTLRIQYTISACSGTASIQQLPVMSKVASTTDVGRTGGEEEEEEEEALVCRICWESPRNALPLTCKHLSMCLGCASQVDQCPICRAPFSPDEITQIYLP